MEGDCIRSNASCRKESTAVIEQVRGFSWWEERNSTNRLLTLWGSSGLEVLALADVTVPDPPGVGHLEPPHPVQRPDMEFPEVDAGAIGCPSLREQLLWEPGAWSRRLQHQVAVCLYSEANARLRSERQGCVCPLPWLYPRTTRFMYADVHWLVL